MGKVYLARDEVLGRDVALKLLREQYAEDGEFVERFRREARSAAALSHPNVVPVFDLGRSEDGAYYMAMEYVPGGTLKDRLVGGGALRPAAAIAVAAQIAAALEVAHARKIVHRDVKPQNVLVSASGAVKVADFGIAGVADSATTAGPDAALVVGTARYMSPEQVLGKPAGPASDLYSLGVVFYEMLTGEPPFAAENPVATAAKRLTGPPPSPRLLDPEIPEALDSVVVKLLARKPEDRHGSVAELLGDLERLRDGLPPAAGGSGTGTAPTILPGAAAHAGVLEHVAGGRRRRTPLPVLLLAVLALLGAIGWGVFQGPWEQEVARGAEDGSRVILEEATGPAGETAGMPQTTVARTDESEEPGESAFVHRAASENISANSTYLDDPLADGNPDAVLSVTQNWNPGSGAGTYNDHAIGVWYDPEAGKWAIFNQDRAAMPEGAAFNVVVYESPTEAR